MEHLSDSPILVHGRDDERNIAQEQAPYEVYGDSANTDGVIAFVELHDKIPIGLEL